MFVCCFNGLLRVQGVANACVLLLADRGHLCYDDCVSKHWPEFAQNGKEKLTVSQLVSHQVHMLRFCLCICLCVPHLFAYFSFCFSVSLSVPLCVCLSVQGGLSYFDSRVDIEVISRAQNIHPDTGTQRWDMNDDTQRAEAERAKQELSDLLAKTTPKWPLSHLSAQAHAQTTPQTAKSGYHALSIGLFVSELVRRVDPMHRSLRDFFAQELALPLNLDFHFGVNSPDVAARCAKLYSVCVCFVCFFVFVWFVLFV